MNIIFGKENADLARDKYTILELDTFKLPNDGPVVTAYCTVEKLMLQHLPVVETMTNLHNDLIRQYGQKNWNTCLDLITRLKGFWSGEIDSFYDDLHARIETMLLDPPPADWTPIIQK